MRKSFIGRTVEGALLAKDVMKMSRAKDATSKTAAEMHLAKRMGKLRGLPQKWGQALSMSGEREEGGAFKKLTDHNEPLPFEVIEVELEKSWGKPWSEVCQHIEPHGLAASLGQVHKAQLHDGRQVAIKVAGVVLQREADLSQIVLTDDVFGFALGFVQRRQQHRRQNRDNSDDHEQFDEREWRVLQSRIGSCPHRSSLVGVRARLPIYTSAIKRE